MFSKRQIVKLEGIEDLKNECHFKILGGQMKLLKIENISVIHNNQRKAVDIIHEFTKDPSVLMVMALGKTQSGKTGVMYACIQVLKLKDMFQ